MPMSTDAATNLSRNVLALRRGRNLSQASLATLAGIPRSTIAHIESGAGNPSLANLARLSAALGVGIEELLARPRNACVLVPAAQVPVRLRASGRVQVADLLPERVRGLEITRMCIEPQATMRGTAHVFGTKEYLHTIEGEVSVLVAGEVFVVSAGDVFAFPGDQAHSYVNRGVVDAVALSVVVPVSMAGPEA